MHNQNSSADLKSQKWRSRLVLFLRWLLGGVAGIVISGWIYFGLKNQTPVGPFLWVLDMLPILSVPFIGHLYLFYQGALSYTHINDFFDYISCALLGINRRVAYIRKKNKSELARFSCTICYYRMFFILSWCFRSPNLIFEIVSYYIKVLLPLGGCGSAIANYFREEFCMAFKPIGGTKLREST